MEASVDIDLGCSLLPTLSRQVPLYRFDVVVVGAGAAGSAAAVAAADAGCIVAVLAKGDLRESNTHYAQGGMAAVLSEEDSFDEHVADTVRVGCGLSRREAVEAVIRGGPTAVEKLIEIGAEFDRTQEGELQLSREGGHSRPRIIHAHGDATGIEMQRALVTSTTKHPNITVFPDTFCIDLLADPNSRVRGVLALTERREPVSFTASQVILATGGGGQLYRETTNPVIATGDGVAMGFRAGAVVRDLEFVQFHPTCLYIAGAARVLISEVVRGAGGVLRDRHGHRFMPGFHDDAELAPRDVVSRAVFSRMVATQDTSVYLDLSRLDGDPHQLFPGISRICHFFGIDIAKDPVPVRPGAHYMIGGLRVDLDGRTSLPGLWAVGECASSGLHGANRMGSNSLLEALVLGMRAGRLSAGEVGPVELQSPQGTHIGGNSTAPERVKVNIADVTYSLKSMMWRQVGVERDEVGLGDALEKIAFWSRAVSQLAPPEPRSWELQNMLILAQLATFAASERRESRGVHYRTDHPKPKEEERTHSNMVADLGEGGAIRRIGLTREPVTDPVPTR